MVVCWMTLMVSKKKRSEIEKKTKWWKLKKEECCEEFRQKLRQGLAGQVVLPNDWETTAEVIRESDQQKDLEKAVPRGELWYCMRKSGVAEKSEWCRTVVRCAVGQTEEFKVEVELNQGSALSPFLFAIVVDQSSEEVRQESPWTMMFADDIVICSESRTQVRFSLRSQPMYQSGKGYKAISKALGLPRTTVRAIIYKWRKHGTVENLPRSGRPTKITPRAQRQLIQEVTKDPTTTSKELQASLDSGKTGLIADLFDILLPMLNIYQEFVRNHQYSLQILAHCKQNRDFDKLLKHYESKPDCEERTLETFLTYPMFQGAGGNWATVGRRSRGGRRVHRQREKRKGKSVRLRIGTLNVGTMTGKGRELADKMERRKVDILCVQETRWNGSKAHSIGAGFKLFYYGVDSKRNGVGVVLKEAFVRNVLEGKRVSDRVMSLKLEIEGVVMNVVSGYAPQVGCELEEKERFWSELDEVMESISTGERVVIGADFNGHVGEGNRGDEEVMGKFGVKERNLEGQMVVDFAKRMDMAVVYTYFQKREEHRVTYKSEDLEKAYDRVPREELWYCMRKSGVAEKYVRVLQDMYERNRTVVRCAVGQTEEFKVEVGLHQRSALSPFLFAIVMDQLSEEVRQESPWTMMFADNIVICSESREQVEENLERWRFALERRGMKVSHSKTEYMCVNEREGSGTVRLQGEEVKKVQEFKYLGSTVQSNGECGKEVKKQVQAGWNGWRKVSGVLCDQKISARIKGKVYRTVVRPAMLYGLETVSLRKRQESELEVAELKMLRFSLGVTRLDRIRNEYIRGTAHVGCLGDKVREARLRWFGHVQRRERSLIQVPMSEKGKITRGRLGSLSLKKEGERQCFLFSKHLIICTRGSGGKLHLTKAGKKNLGERKKRQKRKRELTKAGLA
ncbi:hypothetical protein QTP86_009157 [Hemibagrus guttatus]|nr:hypothetical protein QTP86_009157 [Hemibagrus guttatus]